MSQKKLSTTMTHLEETIKRLHEECKLDSWNALVEEVNNLPTEVAFALMCGRPELVNLSKNVDRQHSRQEWDALIDLIRILLQTNRLLQQHAEHTAELVNTWMGHFKGLQRAAEQIKCYAHFRSSVTDDDE